MAFRPLADRVLVRRVEQSKTEGGLIIPDSAKEKSVEGEVISVGSGVYVDGKLIPLDVRPGDRVAFTKFSGTEIKADGEDCLILVYSEILGVRLVVPARLVRASGEISKWPNESSSWLAPKKLAGERDGTNRKVPAQVQLLLSPRGWLLFVADAIMRTETRCSWSSNQPVVRTNKFNWETGSLAEAANACSNRAWSTVCRPTRGTNTHAPRERNITRRNPGWEVLRANSLQMCSNGREAWPVMVNPGRFLKCR